jgi:hypothetical protein
VNWRFATAGAGTLLLVLAVGASALAARNGIREAQACRNGGWQSLATSSGNSFSSESECAAYAGRGEPLVSCTVSGTRGDDLFATVPTGSVVCGFGGNDTVKGFVNGTFYGGRGNDVVDNGEAASTTPGGVAGTFVGGAGNDRTTEVYAGGTFIGGAGNDTVSGGNVANVDDGTFNGGAGDDAVDTLTGTFDGGPGHDTVDFLFGGTFIGDAGNDLVSSGAADGIYNGGTDTDTLCLNQGMHAVINVEILQC